jgi:hypothetical protein
MKKFKTKAELKSLSQDYEFSTSRAGMFLEMHAAKGSKP